jgi:hypothetical protein
VASGSRGRVGRAVLFVVGLLARVVGAGALFWLVFPLWLGVFWSVQGYPPTLGDFARWYALGAFNAAPIVATVGVSPLILAFRWVAWKPSPPVSPSPAVRERGNSAPLSHSVGEGQGVRAAIVIPLLTALLYTLLVPPVAYALLLVYAEVWQYRAWEAMTPTLMRAYGFLGGAAFVVGWAVGWSMRPSGRRTPARAVARRN